MENTLLNLIPSSYIPEIHLSQYDVGRTIPFKLMEGNSEYSIPSGANIKILATKPSGLGFEVACTFSGNVVTLVNTETMSNEAGRFRAELRITSGNVILGTSNFIMNVERSPHPEGTIDGDAETLLPELTLLVERIENSNARIESMTATATPVPSGQNPTANYNETTNTLELGIPVADKQYVNIGGVNYPIASITKTTANGIEGYLVLVDDGTADGQTDFFANGFGLRKVRDEIVEGINSTKADAIVKSASGSIASFSDGGDELPMKSLKVNIVPKQSGSGDPSPSNVRAISGWDSVNTNATGVNVWDEEWESNKTHYNGNPISYNGYGVSKNKIAVFPNTTYYFKSPATNFEILEFGREGNFLRSKGAYFQNTTFTTEADTYYIAFGSATNGAYVNYNNDISINYPSTDHEYHPYDGQTVTTNLGQTVYGGTVDIIEGKGQPTYFYFKPLGSESTITDLGTFWGWVGDTAQTPYGYGNNPQDGECSHFKFGTECIVGVDSSSGAYFLIYKTALPNISTLAEFKTWVANQRTNGTPLEVAYRLATPTASEFDTTPTEVKTKLGSNNVWSESGTVEVEYRADTTLAYNELLSLIASLS